MLKVWLIGLSTAAVICGVVALVLLPTAAHSAEACTSVEVIKKQALDSGLSTDNVYILAGAKQANIYANNLGLIFPDDSQPTGWLFIELPNGVVAGLIEDDCIRYGYRVEKEAHQRAIGAIMRGA